MSGNYPKHILNSGVSEMLIYPQSWRFGTSEVWDIEFRDPWQPHYEFSIKSGTFSPL